MNDTELNALISLLNHKRGFDFSAYHSSFVERQVHRHLESTGESNIADYLNLIEKNEDHLDRLTDLLTVNVSSFFRDPLTFEIIAQVILPKIIAKKRKKDFTSLRIWSAGCSHGEEAYSMAILIKDAFKKESFDFRVELFATDIDQKALEKAEQAIFGLKSVENTRHRLLREYFTCNNDLYTVVPEIKDMVHFSSFDMIDKKHHAPMESIFGDFDVILCRNVLIYFKKEFQEIILAKLTRSLASEGYLVLGECEGLSEIYQRRYSKITDFCKIYQKNI
ncbi:protein-glutamate O-methyltransferase CheR [bacterium]|nr:protein-glutamate O-methyltransferase CheR [bacterium]